LLDAARLRQRVEFSGLERLGTRSPRALLAYPWTRSAISDFDVSSESKVIARLPLLRDA